MSSSESNQIAFSFLFRMNDLYQGYIGEVLKLVLRETVYDVWSQHTEKRLLENVYSGRGNILLKPDFVIVDENSIPKIIVDTKWLVPDSFPGKYIEVCQVRLDSLQASMEDVGRLLSEGVQENRSL
ncbi:McrC family protein [Oceanobacillus saliphilus]|uniref:McrC family protein n=1 Tax=Oceanobacillus saliphilus TaxID=2925834 RepID=UPI00201D647C|nr:McrC family protein [Oceanobacillus saliphilus]